MTCYSHVGNMTVLSMTDVNGSSHLDGEREYERQQRRERRHDSENANEGGKNMDRIREKLGGGKRKDSEGGKRPPNVSVEPPVYSQIKKEASNQNMHVVHYINTLLKSFLDKQAFRKIYFPNLHYIGMYERHMFIKDDRMDQTAEISIKDRQIYCCLCKAGTCEHSFYAMARPEVAYLLLEITQQNSTNNDKDNHNDNRNSNKAKNNNHNNNYHANKISSLLAC
jgi:hypothetical protein